MQGRRGGGFTIDNLTKGFVRGTNSGFQGGLGMPTITTTVTWKNGVIGDILDTANWTGGVAPASGDTGVIGAGTVEILSTDTLPYSTLTLDLGASQTGLASAPTSILLVEATTLGVGLPINDTNTGGTITKNASGPVEGAALVISGTVNSGATMNIGAGDALDIVSYTGPNDTFNNSGQINVVGTSSNYGVLYIGTQPGSSVALTATYGAISVADGFLAAAAADSGAGTITLSGNSEALATASLQNTAIDFASGKNTLALGQTTPGAASYESVGAISGFQQGDKIALLSDGSAGAAAASDSYSSGTGVLTILNSSSQTLASLDIGTTYGNQGFYLSQNSGVDANSAVTTYTTQYDIAVGDLWTGGAGSMNPDCMTSMNWSDGAPASGGVAIIGAGTAEITAADTFPSSLNIAVGTLQSSFNTVPGSVLVVANDTLSSGLSIDNMAVGGMITSPSATQIMGSSLVVDGTVTSQAKIKVGAGDAEFVVAGTGSDNFVNQGQINLNGTPGSGGSGNSAVLFFGPAPGSTGSLTVTYGAINDSSSFIDANAADSGAGTVLLNNGELFVTADLKDTAVQFAGGSDGGELALGQTAPGAATYQSIGTITGFQQNDDIALLSDGGAAAAPTTLAFNNGVLSVYDGKVVLEKLDVGNNYAGQTFYLTTQPDTNDNSFNTNFTTRYDITVGQPYGGTQIASVTVACYCAGTLIATARGEVAVEELQIGDLVLTASGALRPLKWIGTRAYSARFAGNNPDLLPIRFMAGSLADNVPARDLLVSPKHAMFLDGVLIPAEHLVNGATIVQEQPGEDIHYFHLELDSHDVLIAEGAFSESFVDDDSRGMFQNARDFQKLYPGERAKEAVYCAPRVEDGYALDRVRRRLAERAGLAFPAATDFGLLLGVIEHCDHEGVSGWALNTAFPNAPVCLDVIVDGAFAGYAYAETEKPNGDRAFSLRFRAPLDPASPHEIELRRSADGALLGDGLIPAEEAAA